MLNEEQKKFILKSYKNRSVRQISKHLDISRIDVSNFIKNIENVPASGLFFKCKKVLIPLSIFILLVVHLALRYNTFWLSHFRGDQNHYTGLAMKLQELGFDDYNLRGIDMMPSDDKHQVYAVSLSKDKEGSLMRSLKHSGAGYYDIPFFHKGPAFSIALMISHRIFSRSKDYLLVQEHLGKQVFNTKPKYFFSSQFYAVIVPLFFSTILMLLTFYLGKMLFSYRIGFYAAFMMAVNPISILTSHKLWTDDMLSVFVTLSVILFFLAQKKDTLWLSFLSGISCGIAVLTKQNAGILFPGLIVYSILIKRTFKHLITYGIGLTLVSAPWFCKIYSIYKDPLYMPVNKDILQTDTTGWFKRISSRPPPFKLFTIGIPYLSPPFILFYATLKDFIPGLRLWIPVERMSKERDNIMLLWFWILTFFLFLVFYTGGDEHRRMLPAYPAIAVLSAYILNKLRIFIERLFNNNILPEIIIIVILIASAFWSAPMGIATVMENDAIITKPF